MKIKLYLLGKTTHGIICWNMPRYYERFKTHGTLSDSEETIAEEKKT